MIGLLEEIEAAAAPARTSIRRAAADYKGSLDFIDSLPKDPPFLSVKTGYRNRGRDLAMISNAVIPSVSRTAVNSALPRGSVLLVDNRRWNPAKDYDAGDLEPQATDLVVSQPKIPKPRDPIEKVIWRERRVNPAFKNWYDTEKLAFRNPFRVAICVKRSIRREVMHALGMTGMWHRPKHWNPYSWVRC